MLFYIIICRVGDRNDQQTETEVVTATRSYITFYLADFFNETRVAFCHQTAKVNSRDVRKCNRFWVPSYDLFSSARKAIFPAPTATAVHRL